MRRKTALDYFSFDVDFFEDDKIRFVSKRFGLVGESLLIRILCRVYRNGYFLEWNKDMARLFAKGVGSDGSHTLNKLTNLANDIVYESVKRGFFDRGIFDKFNILTSKGIQHRYFSGSVGRKRPPYVEAHMLVNIGQYAFRDFKPVNAEIFPANNQNLSEEQQSKVDEKELTTNTTTRAGASVFDENIGNSGFAKIQWHYEKYIGGPVSNTAALEIIDFLNAGVEPELICKAIDESVDANARNWFYARSIINSCITSGILTLEQFKVNKANRDANKSRKSDTTQSGVGTRATPKPNRFINFNQREIDFDKYEKLERAYLEQKLKSHSKGV